MEKRKPAKKRMQFRKTVLSGVCRTFPWSPRQIIYRCTRIILEATKANCKRHLKINICTMHYLDQSRNVCDVRYKWTDGNATEVNTAKEQFSEGFPRRQNLE